MRHCGAGPIGGSAADWRSPSGSRSASVCPRRCHLLTAAASPLARCNLWKHSAPGRGPARRCGLAGEACDALPPAPKVRQEATNRFGFLGIGEGQGHDRRDRRGEPVSRTRPLCCAFYCAYPGICGFFSGNRWGVRFLYRPLPLNYSEPVMWRMRSRRIDRPERPEFSGRCRKPLGTTRRSSIERFASLRLATFSRTRAAGWSSRSAARIIPAASTARLRRAATTTACLLVGGKNARATCVWYECES